MLKLYTSKTVLRLTTQAGCNIRSSYSYSDINRGTFEPYQIGAKILDPITTASKTLIVPAPSAPAYRTVLHLAFENASAADSLIHLEEYDGKESNTRLKRVLLTGEIAQFSYLTGWSIMATTGLSYPAVAG